MPEGDFQPDLQSPWLLRIELDKMMMLDKRLECVEVASRIGGSYLGLVHVISSEDNADKLVLRIRLIDGALLCVLGCPRGAWDAASRASGGAKGTRWSLGGSLRHRSCRGSACAVCWSAVCWSALRSAGCSGAYRLPDVQTTSRTTTRKSRTCSWSSSSTTCWRTWRCRASATCARSSCGRRSRRCPTRRTRCRATSARRSGCSTARASTSRRCCRRTTWTRRAPSATTSSRCSKSSASRPPACPSSRSSVPSSSLMAPRSTTGAPRPAARCVLYSRPSAAATARVSRARRSHGCRP